MGSTHISGQIVEHRQHQQLEIAIEGTIHVPNEGFNKAAITGEGTTDPADQKAAFPLLKAVGQGHSTALGWCSQIKVAKGQSGMTVKLGKFPNDFVPTTLEHQVLKAVSPCKIAGV